MQINIQQAIFLAGAGQVVLSAGSLAIPGILDWRNQLNNVRSIIKQMFWTYAGYILGINLSFGLISVFLAQDLVAGSALAKAITGFIAIYWISRILIQFFYFDRNDFPKGSYYRVAEIALVALFFSLSIVYGYAFYLNYHHL
jgi:hypothetical protein